MSSANGMNENTAPQTGIQGIPAITPHLNLAANAASTASGGTANLPTFTADDASARVMAHPPLYTATGTTTIGSVTLLPYAQAAQWLTLELGLPAVTPVCVVVLDGSLTDTIPWMGGPPPPGASPTALTYSHAIVVFNGVTGNLLTRNLKNSVPAAPTVVTTPTTTATPGTGTSTPTS
jgi:hypothetical protein